MRTQFFFFNSDEDLVFNHEISLDARFHAKQNIKILILCQMLIMIRWNLSRALAMWHHVNGRGKLLR